MCLVYMIYQTNKKLLRRPEGRDRDNNNNNNNNDNNNDTDNDNNDNSPASRRGQDKRFCLQKCRNIP